MGNGCIGSWRRLLMLLLLTVDAQRRCDQCSIQYDRNLDLCKIQNLDFADYIYFSGNKLDAESMSKESFRG